MFLSKSAIYNQEQFQNKSGFKVVGRSENLGVPVLFGGYSQLPLIEIGLTDLPKIGGAMRSKGFQGGNVSRSKVFLGAKGVKDQSDLRSKVFQGAKGVEKHSVLRRKVF